MQFSGRIIILGTLLVALAMSGAAWWYQYGLSRRAAKFWGIEAATLLAGQSPMALLELAPPSETAPPAGELIAGQAIAADHDLTNQPGIIHLRHALTQDANFTWEGQTREPAAATRQWAYALRFGEENGRLVVLFSRDFEEVGKLDVAGAQVDVLPAPRLGPVFRQYLADIRVLPRREPAAAAR